jgi:hypothetical protein
VSTTAKFCPECGHPLKPVADDTRFASPRSYTPQHLADKILSSQVAVEGERKQVTVLFADIKGSMELFADRDPEAAQKLFDPVLERMIEAVHRYEGTVNRIMGDGIMALFGAPIAREDHAVRACYAALRMQETVARYADEVRPVLAARIDALPAADKHLLEEAAVIGHNVPFTLLHAICGLAKPEDARENLTAAITMYREMGMDFWLEQEVR